MMHSKDVNATMDAITNNSTSAIIGNYSLLGQSSTFSIEPDLALTSSSCNDTNINNANAAVEFKSLQYSLFITCFVEGEQKRIEINRLWTP